MLLQSKIPKWSIYYILSIVLNIFYILHLNMCYNKYMLEYWIHTYIVKFHSYKNRRVLQLWIM